MFKNKDAYSYSIFDTLVVDSTAIGTIAAEYQVTHYDNIQLKDGSSLDDQPRKRNYLVQCTQRIAVFNPAGIVLSPSSRSDAYENYPVMLNAIMSMVQSTNGFRHVLLEYSPKTVNTKIQSSGTSGDSSGKAVGTTRSHTVGSSTSETNTYGVSVGIGLSSGEAGDSFSASEHYEHASTVTSERSTTRGSESSRTSSRETSSSAQMSIKDWGAYALFNPTNGDISWTFGQEYPWDAIECRVTTGNVNRLKQTEIVIPSSMSLRLYDGVALYPPSSLAMFGFDFSMKALWLATVDNGSPATVEITHNVDYFSASHAVEGKDVKDRRAVVYMDAQPTRLFVKEGEPLTTSLDLAMMALDPVGLHDKGAVIGFIPRMFTTPPAYPKTGVGFAIISTGNDLIIKDTTPYPTNEVIDFGFAQAANALVMYFAGNKHALIFSIYFKVVDTVDDYALFLKHWKTRADGDADGNGVVLRFTINGCAEAAMTKYVDEFEAEGGENNLMRIGLRNQDFASVDYHDYLRLGLNTVQVEIVPIDNRGCGYQVRAVSVEKT